MIAERSHIIHLINTITKQSFESVALEVFKYQFTHNSLYNQFAISLAKNPGNVKNIEAIPFLPISFFKSHKIQTGSWSAEQIFKSSGTSGQIRSQHYLKSLDWYQNIATSCFEEQYGKVQDWCFLCLLPSYLERSDASLVYMCDHFIHQSKYESSGFYLNDFDSLRAQLKTNMQQDVPSILIGVSFALLDFIENAPLSLTPNIFVMETGGMKGRRKEMNQTALHELLQSGFGVENIHSEYGMTELLSQAYSKGGGVFQSGKYQKILCREITDPITSVKPNKTGILNIIDLANADSLSFIETEDIGINLEDDFFKVTGRMDFAEIRGCNLMLNDFI